MSEELIPEPLSLDEQIDNKLVKANVTEAVIAELRERYLPLRIAGIEDKETYLEVKEGRKKCKAIRVLAKQICVDGREDAVAIQKKWVAKEKEVTSRIAEVEDYLEQQEKAYEAQVAAEKEARKRKQEEQLIMRQQELGKMNVLYSGGAYILGEVSFDLAAIKESDDDVWIQSILPLYQEEYSKIEAERIEQDRIKAEKEAELKRQQEELEAERKKLKDEADRLQAEREKQELEVKKRAEDLFKLRTSGLFKLGLKPHVENGHSYMVGHGFFISHLDISGYDESKWDDLISRVSRIVAMKIEEEAEAERKEQERVELQNKRYAEMYPFLGYGGAVKMDELWQFEEQVFQEILSEKKSAFEKAEEEKAKEIAEKAAKAERERIEEEQRKTEVNRKYELRKSRMSLLVEHHLEYHGNFEVLGEISEESWMKDFNELKQKRDEIIRKQEEERKAEELAKASDKEKWDEIGKDIEALRVLAGSLVMRSGQYRKKRQMLLEKLEEIKAL